MLKKEERLNPPWNSKHYCVCRDRATAHRSHKQQTRSTAINSSNYMKKYLLFLLYTGLLQIKKLIIVTKSKVLILEFQKLKLEANSKSLLWIRVDMFFQQSEQWTGLPTETANHCLQSAGMKGPLRSAPQPPLTCRAASKSHELEN